MYAELMIVECVTVRGGVMVAAAVRTGAMGKAGAAMRVAVRGTLNLFARVALRGGAFDNGSAVCWGCGAGCVGHVRRHAHNVSRIKVPVAVVARGPAGSRTKICGHR